MHLWNSTILWSFPPDPLRRHSKSLEVNDVQLFRAAELLAAISSLPGGKAVRPNGDIPTNVLKIVAREFPTLLLGKYNALKLPRLTYSEQTQKTSVTTALSRING